MVVGALVLQNSLDGTPVARSDKGDEMVITVLAAMVEPAWVADLEQAYRMEHLR